MNIAVLDIGGTSIKSGLYSAGKVEKLSETSTNALNGGPYVIEQAIKILKNLGDFDRIGISTAGQVNSSKGSIIYANANIPNYTGMQVRDLLQQEFDVPVAVENDVNAAAIGEAAFGAGKEYHDFLCLTYGTGVGGAVVINQKIYTGSGFSAGEFGGIITHASKRNPEEDIFSGCYERYASTTALVKMATNYDASLNNGKKIFDRMNEPEVKAIVDQWIHEIVYGLVSLIHIFNPSCVILGGGIMKEKYILEKINTILYNNIMSSYANVVMRQAELGNQAGLLGAAKLASDFA